MTTRAVFQKFESIGWPWASASIAARICSSLSDLTRSQSLRIFDGAPVRFSFMSLRLPSRDDAPLIIGNIRVNHGDLDTVCNADSINAGFVTVHVDTYLGSSEATG